MEKVRENYNNQAKSIKVTFHLIIKVKKEKPGTEFNELERSLPLASSNPHEPLTLNRRFKNLTGSM